MVGVPILYNLFIFYSGWFIFYQFGWFEKSFLCLWNAQYSGDLELFVNCQLIREKINYYFLEIRKKEILLQSRLLSLEIRSVNS